MIRETEVLTDVEVQAMLESISRTHPRGKRNFAMLKLMLQTGIRCNEMVQIRESDIHDEIWDVEGEAVPIKVLRLRKGTTKGQKTRMGIPLSQDTLEALADWIKWRDESGIEGGPLFCAVREKVYYPPDFYNGHRVKPKIVHPGEQLSTRNIGYMFKQIAKQAGVTKRVHPHMSRHTALTNLYDRTQNIRLVQDVAGHSSPNETQRYTHVHPVSVAKAMGAI